MHTPNNLSLATTTTSPSSSPALIDRKGSRRRRRDPPTGPPARHPAPLALELVVQPQVRAGLLEQPDALGVAHLLGEVQRRVVGAVAGVHAGAAHEQVPQDQRLRPDGGEVQRRVARVVGPLEQLLVELVALEDLADRAQLAVADRVAEGGEGRFCE